MNLTGLAIANNRTTYILLFVILAAGISAYYGLPRAEDPGFIIRTAQVRTFFPGASPERVEQLVTDKLEKVVQQMPEIDFINSESKSGVSILYVNILESYSEMRPIWDNLRRKVERASRELPPDVIGPFVNDEFGDVYGTIIALTGDGFSYAELKTIADECRNELLLLGNVAKVDIYGAQEERIFVEFNNAQLAEFGLSPFQLKQILEARNIIIPGGEVFTAEEQIVLEPTGNFESVEELRRTIVKLPDRERVTYLEDIASIRRSYIDPPEELARFNGDPALVLAINMREGGNIIDLGREVMAQVNNFRNSYPIGVEFDVAAFQPYYVEKKVDDFVVSLLQAIGIVVFVMLVFLGVRTGLVVASLIPMAMIAALLVMSAMEIGLDQLSLAALIISLGLLVDNSIVMSESIMVRMAGGKKPIQAAIDSASELRTPLLIASLTTSAAFLPIYLAESSTGEYTAGLFKVVTITLICSWILSLTMIPLLCATFLRVKSSAGGQSLNSRMYRVYRNFLITGLKNRWISVAIVAVVFIVAIQGLGLVPAIFFPPSDKPILTVEMKLPIGSPLRRTEATVEQIEAFMKAELMADTSRGEAGIVNWSTFIGQGAPRYTLGYGPEPPAPEYSYMLINSTDVETSDTMLIPRLEQFCQEHLPDLTAKIKPLSLGPPVNNPVEVRLSGKSNDRLFALVDRVKARMEEIGGLKNIVDNWGPRTKKLVVDINQPRAQRSGLSNQDIAVSLQTILTGIELSDYREEDEVIPITLRSVAADRLDIGKLESHNIYVQASGRRVPLKQVADIRLEWQPSKILRRDRLRTVAVQAQTIADANAIAKALELDEWLKIESADWGIGYKYELGGELETSGEANESIMVKLPFAFMLIVLLLVAQFNSVRKPVIILLTIPLGMIGVTVGLLIAQSYFGFMTLLGIISLAGIVINNGIVLIDRIRIEQDENGLDPTRAVVVAAQRRLRPILLTTATTVGGLLPLWFGGSPMFIPMAIAVIFGLMFATVLTLGFVPILYSLLFRIRFGDFEY